MDTLSNKRARAEAIVNRFALGSGATAMATGPMPGTSVLLIAGETLMTYQVAREFGFHPTIQEAGVTIGALTALSGGLKHLAIETATAIPLLGWWLVKPGIAAVTSKMVGKIVIEHYVAKCKEQHGS